MAVDAYSYSNESERANQVIYADWKLKKLLVSMVYTNIFQRDEG